MAPQVPPKWFPWGAFEGAMWLNGSSKSSLVLCVHSLLGYEQNEGQCPLVHFKVPLVGNPKNLSYKLIKTQF